MKQYIHTNKLLFILLLISLAVSFVVIGSRWRAEAKNKTYDVVLDYTELELLAEQSDKDIQWWLEQFRDMGITQVGLTEESLITLMENSPLAVSATMMDKVIQDAAWMEHFPAGFVDAITRYGYDRFDVLIEASGQEAADFVSYAISRRFHTGDSVIFRQDDECFILLNGTVTDTLYAGNKKYITSVNNGFVERNEIISSKLMFVSLGLMPDKVETIQKLGMKIVPRTLCYKGHNDTHYARAVVEDYEKYHITPTYMIAGGEAVIGYDDISDGFAINYIRDNNITIGLIETNVQRENILQTGVEDVAKATGYQTVRVFSVWDYIQYRYAYYGYEGAEEVQNTLYRALVERNIRIIYFKPVKQTNDSHSYITDINVYRDLFDGLDARLEAHGLQRGEASLLDNIHIPRLALLALGLGASVGGALLPSTFLPMKKKWTLLLAGAASMLATAAWAVAPNLFRLLASFASAVVFACLAAAFFLQAAKRAGQSLPTNAKLTAILPRSLLILAGAVLISLAGAMMTAAPLSSTEYMLEIGIFRGVKLAQLLPLAFFCILFVSYYGVFEKDRASNVLHIDDVVTAMRWTIPVWSLAVLAVVAVAGNYYLARTGHESNVTVSTIELIFRNDLENLLLARPRTKEFLVAFPCIMLTVYCAIRRLPFFTALFGLAGTIGVTSICNTFMHIRTPLYLGFVRTAYSLVLGAVIGALYIWCFDLAYRVWEHFQRR